MLKRRSFIGMILLCIGMICVVCSGCQARTLGQKQLSVADLTVPPNAQMVICMDGQEYRGALCYDPSGVVSIALDSPEDLQGLSCFWQGDHFKMTYQGLSVEAKECPLLDTSFAVLLLHALNGIRKPTSLTASGNNAFEGIEDGMPFTVTAGPDGTVQSIEIPRFEFVAVFSLPEEGET